MQKIKTLSVLPPELITALKNVDGFDEDAFRSAHRSANQVVSIRFNPAKCGQRSVDNEELEKIPWSSNGYYLKERPSFTLDPSFHAGAYYVQEASSMFLEQAVRQTVDLDKPLRVLDLCAAPGGKSTLLQSLISPDSLLISNEVIKTRVNMLKENLIKWGGANCMVTHNDPRDFQKLENYFDLVVVDAPCSGSGLFRKDPGAVEEWSENNVLLCAARQQRIVADIIPALKAGGILIYSTCSYSEQEDEEIADWLLADQSIDNRGRQFETVPIKIDPQWRIVETRSARAGAYGYRFYPDKLKGEGFFIAAFRKKDPGTVVAPGQRVHRAKPKNNPGRLSANSIGFIRPYIKNAEDYFYFTQHDDLIAFRVELENELPLIQSALYIKNAGVKLGMLIRDELIPAHDLAVSQLLDPAVPRLAVNLELALQYLRKATVNLDTDLRGWVLLTFMDLPIGWIKLMTNRVNNYYPAAWRILNK